MGFLASQCVLVKGYLPHKASYLPLIVSKIDKDGVLQGGEAGYSQLAALAHATCRFSGRQFKAQTFVLPHRHPTRQYMLPIGAARTSGYKDSLYYFRRNSVMHKRKG